MELFYSTHLSIIAVIFNGVSLATEAESDPQDLESLWDMVENISTQKIAQFLRSNIVGTIIILSLIVWVPACCYISYLDRKKRQEEEEQEDWYSQDNIELYDLVWEPTLSIRKTKGLRPRLRLHIPNSESLQDLYSDSLLDLHVENPYVEYMYETDSMKEHCDEQALECCDEQTDIPLQSYAQDDQRRDTNAHISKEENPGVEWDKNVENQNDQHTEITKVPNNENIEEDIKDEENQL